MERSLRLPRSGSTNDQPAGQQLFFVFLGKGFIKNVFLNLFRSDGKQVPLVGFLFILPQFI